LTGWRCLFRNRWWWRNIRGRFSTRRRSCGEGGGASNDDAGVASLRGGDDNMENIYISVIYPNI
jgi:hypothetical protein